MLKIIIFCTKTCKNVDFMAKKKTVDPKTQISLDEAQQCRTHREIDI